MTARPILAVALVLGVAALAACGSSSGDTSTSPAPAASTPATSTPAAAATTAPKGTVDVSLSEWKIAPSTASVPAGKVTFDVKNAGSMPHEMVVIKTDTPADALGTGAQVSEKGSVGEVEDVDAGASKSKTLDLKPGKYVLICNLPGHYMQGMRTAFTVS